MDNSKVEPPLQHYQPIDVPESPVSQKQGNLTGSPRIVQDSAADLYNYVQEWNSQHLIGVGIISEICRTKIPQYNEHVTKGSYPDGLQGFCDKLEELCHKLEALLLNMKIVINHIEGAVKLSAMKKNVNPVFTTWRIEEYEDLSKKIYGMYETDLQLKFYIKENIGHAVTVENVLLYQTLWVQQPYVDSLSIQIEAMLKETNLRQ